MALGTKGDVHDTSGLASTILAKRIRWKHSSGAFVGLIGKMQDAGLVTRTTRGRRTFDIELTADPDSFPIEWTNGHGQAPEAATTDATSAVEASDGSVATSEAPEAPEALEANGHGPVDLVALEAPDTDAWLAAVMDNGGVDYQLLAVALLERVVDVVAHNTGDDDTYEHATVLSVQLTHANNQADKLRHRIQVLERELAISAGRIKATRVELAEEQRQHRGTHDNLRRVMDLARSFNANAGLDEDRRNALAKMLREIPIAPTTQRNIK